MGKSDTTPSKQNCMLATEWEGYMEFIRGPVGPGYCMFRACL